MRNRRKKRRGISAGTIAMLMVTSLVILGLVLVLPPLVGDRPVQIDTSQMLSGLNLGEIVPTLSLSQIPLEDDHQTASAPSANDTSSAGGEIPLPQATRASLCARYCSLQVQSALSHGAFPHIHSTPRRRIGLYSVRRASNIACCDSRLMLSKRLYSLWKISGTMPVSPIRCLAIMTSATPLSGLFVS